MFKSRTFKIVLVVAVVLILAVGAYAFAASNTVPSTYAGDGQGTISGYEIANVNYTYDLNNTYITSIAFVTKDKVSHDLAQAAVAQIQLASGGDWFSCSSSNQTSWTCDTTTGADNSGVAVTSATMLRVVAHQ